MPDDPKSVSLGRIVVAAGILLPVLYALIVNLTAIGNPPAWDSAITVSPAALTLAESDFDLWAVANMPSSPEGGPSTHATSLYTVLLAMAIAALEPASAFALAHVTSILLVGGLTTATYLLARHRASRYVSSLAAFVVGVLPVVLQQASDIYLDLPLAIVATFACISAVRRRFWLTAGLALLGIALKSSAIFLLPLILVARPLNKAMSKHLAHSVMAGALASIPFLVVLATTHRFGNEVTGEIRLTLLRSSVSLLVLTVDVFAVLIVYALTMYGRLRSRTMDRISKVAGVMFVSFIGVHVATILLSSTIAILPRYYIVVLPAVVCTLLPRARQKSDSRARTRQVAIALLAVLAAFSIANYRGALYPLPDHEFYVVAERSTRAQQLLELQIEGTRQLVATRLPLLIERQVHFRLHYPEMGYVDDTPDDLLSVFIEPLDTIPDEFAMLIERPFANPLTLVEEIVIDEGYDLEYRPVRVGGFESQLIIASKP